MFSKIFLFLFFSTLLCNPLDDPYDERLDEILAELFKKKNVTNLTEISDKIHSYEREFFKLYKKATRIGEMFCDTIDKNIKTFQEIKRKYLSFQSVMDKGKINNTETAKFLDIRADMLFGIRNVEIAIERLNKTKIDCFKDSTQMQKYIDEMKNKNKKSKEELISAINQIIQIENGL